MKKNAVRMLVVSVLMTLLMTVTAFAGEWKQDSKGWWWVNDEGSYPVNTWQWIDGNKDGIAECYYFDAVGYCLLNTTTPDGYQVDANGAWIVNGVPETKQVVTSNTQITDESLMLGTYYFYDYWINMYLDWVTLHCEKNNDGTYHIYTVYKEDGMTGIDFTCYARRVEGDMAGTAFYPVGTEEEKLRFVDSLQEFAYWGPWEVEYFGKTLSQ